MLTGSSLYTSSSSELLYIMITFFGTSCPYLSRGFFFGIHGLAANLGSLFWPLGSRSWLSTSFELLSIVVTVFGAACSYVLLVASFRFVSGRGVSKLAVAEVPWVWLTMSWSSNGCSPLLLFDN